MVSIFLLYHYERNEWFTLLHCLFVAPSKIQKLPLFSVLTTSLLARYLSASLIVTLHVPRGNSLPLLVEFSCLVWHFAISCEMHY